MTMLRTLTLVCALAGLTSTLAACGSDDAPAGPAVLSPEPAAGAGSGIYLKGRADGDKLAVDVFVRGAPDVHGVALRLTYAPAVLKLADATPAPAWPAGSVALAKEGVPGETAVTWAAKGTAAGLAAQEETLLGTLRFEVKGRAETPLAFRTERSRVIDSKGATVALEYHGGKIGAR